MKIVIEARAEFNGSRRKREEIARASSRVRTWLVDRTFHRANAASGNARNVRIRKDGGKYSAIHPSRTNRTGEKPENGPVFLRTSMADWSK
jgi:hypothetical protein